MYIHSAQVQRQDIAPSNLTAKAAQTLAQVLGLQAFVDTETGLWHAFSDDSAESISLDPEMYFRLLAYRAS